jgi:hypothetical protein
VWIGERDSCEFQLLRRNPVGRIKFSCRFHPLITSSGYLCVHQVVANKIFLKAVKSIGRVWGSLAAFEKNLSIEA